MQTTIRVGLCVFLVLVSCEDFSTDHDSEISIHTNSTIYSTSEEIQISMTNNTQQLIYLKSCCSSPDVRIQKYGNAVWQVLESTCDELMCPSINIHVQVGQRLNWTFGIKDAGRYRLMVAYSKTSTVQFFSTAMSNEFCIR